MKGTLKAIKRTPHMLTTKVGMSSASTDAETEELKRRFAIVQEETGNLLKDSKAYRDGVASMTTSSTSFATAMAGIFAPTAADPEPVAHFPEFKDTPATLESFQSVVTDLRDTLQPELELIDSRIIAPLKEYTEVLKKVQKAIVKRDHKLTDFDRFNNDYTKSREKKDKSLKDEQNMFKIEQAYEQAMQDYEQHNGLLKTDLPRFLECTTAFISPLFHSFYYMQLNILYISSDKMRTFVDERFPVENQSVEEIYHARLGNVGAEMENLTITRKFVSTAKLMSTRRQGSTESYGSPQTGSPSLSAKPTLSAKPSISAKPPIGAKTGFAPPVPAPAPPPPYSGSPAAGVATGSGKRAPPPPPVPRTRPEAAAPAVDYVTAKHAYAAQEAGDLSFEMGDRIEVIKRTESENDWWEGRLNGVSGIFPANRVE